MAVLCYSYSDGHVLHHFMLQRSCLLQSGALPGRYGFLFLFLPPSAPLESSSAGSRSRLESDFASQSRSSVSARGREHWWWVTALRQRTPLQGPRVIFIWTPLSGRTLVWLKLSSPVPLLRTLVSRENCHFSYAHFLIASYVISTITQEIEFWYE